MRITEADIAAAKTPAGGWTRETLLSWGVSWPPKKGWKDKLLAAQPRWLGRSRAVKRTELAIWYWENDADIADIIEAYAPNSHVNQIAGMAGKALLLGAVCRECELPVYATSRSDAETRLRDEEIQGFKGHLCRGCKEAQRTRDYSGGNSFYEAQECRQRELAAMPYADYLRTPEWQETRQAALKRARFTCQTCAGGGELHVHHRTYVRRGMEWSSDLIVLCAKCHALFHDNGRLADGGRAAA